MWTLDKIFTNKCRILTGLTFIASGFVKGIDPLGSTYKFTDYFTAFNIPGLTAISLILAILLAAIEFYIGISLVVNTKIKTASWASLIFMCIMTPLTLFLAIANPISDCGCFGDAWTLTNWQTFGKNVILLLMTLVIFWQKDNYKANLNAKAQIFVLLTTIIAFISIELHCLSHLPLIDFRPYAIGVNINEGLVISNNEDHSQYEITLKYKNKNTGEIQEFTEQNYPWQDTLNWEYHSTDEKLIKEGYQSPLKDFKIEHPTYGDITYEILNNDNYTFLSICYDITKTDATHQDNFNKLADFALENGHQFYGVSASNLTDISKYTNKHNISYDFCIADEVVLKTIIRSNPGLLLINKGTIIGKWADQDIPNKEQLKDKELNAFCIRNIQQTKNLQTIWILVFAYFIWILLYQRFKKKR